VPWSHTEYPRACEAAAGTFNDGHTTSALGSNMRHRFPTSGEVTVVSFESSSFPWLAGYIVAASALGCTRLADAPSRTSRIFLARKRIENGFCTYAVPDSWTDGYKAGPPE